MNIYSFPTFNLTKILLTAEETEHPYQLNLLDPMKGEHKLPEHVQRHPLGKVPTVEIDGENYFESNAICRLIAERQQNKLYANTPEQRAKINQWLDLSAMHIGRWLAVLLFEQKIKPAFFGGETNQDAVVEAKEFLAQQLPVLEKQLSNSAFLTGAQLTIADIVAFSYFDTIKYVDFDVSDYPLIDKWIASMSARPSYKRAMAQLPGGEVFAFLNQ